MKVQGGYGTVSRSGSWVSFNYGTRFTPNPDASSTWTYNSVCAIVGGKNYYAMKSGNNVHTQKNEWIYAHEAYPGAGYKRTAESIPFGYGGHVSGTGGGTIWVSVGTAWDEFTPDQSTYNYSFPVSYPAAASYKVSYNANGGSNAPSSQTKYQGYNLTLTSSTPTRAGYAFNGWNTNSSGTGTNYSAGGTYSADSGVTLYAKWTALAPIFSAPTVSRTETEISWPAFTTNIASNIYYRINNGDWVGIGSDTTTGAAKKLTGYTPGTAYTIDFKAENKVNIALSTTHSVSVTTYNYPSISSFTAPINAGATQTFSLYNPLGRSVTIALTKIGSTSQSFVSTTVTGTTANFVVPLEAIAKILTNKSSDTGTYTLTYGGTVRDTKTGQINIPATTAPTINESKKNSFFSYQDCATFIFGGSGSTSKAMSTFSGSNQRLLQGYSKMQYSLVSANNPFGAQYGASISSYKVQINNKTATAATLGTTYYEGASAGVTASGKAVVVTANNTYTITISATDSRGFTSSYTRTISTYVYSKPTVSITSAYRKDGYGTAAAIILSGSWSSGMTGANVGKSITLYYKESTASSYSSKALYTNSGSASSMQSLAVTMDIPDVAFNSEKAYIVYVVVTDGFGQSTQSANSSIALGTPVLFVDTEQLGVGVNCFPTVAGLEVKGPIKATGNITTSAAIQTSGSINAGTSLNAGSDIVAAGRVSGKEFRSFGLGPKNTENKTEFRLIGSQKMAAWNNGRLTFAISSRHSGNGIISICYGCSNATVNKTNTYCNIEYIGSYKGGDVFNQQMIVAHLKEDSSGVPTLYFFWRYVDYDSAWITVLSKFNAFTPTNNGEACLTNVDTTTYGERFAVTTASAYPIGAIYMSTSSTSPASLFGGSWEQIKDKFLLGIGNTYKENQSGGSAAVTLKTEQIPGHSHTWSQSSCTEGGWHTHRVGGDHDAGKGAYGWSLHNTDSGAQDWCSYTTGAGNHTHTIGGSIGSTGGGQSHDNMPPYTTVYIWKRIG